MPAALPRLHCLRTLCLAGAGARALPPGLGGLPRLEELDCRDCRLLAFLPPDLGAAPALRALHLGGCDALDALPEEWERVAATGRCDGNRGGSGSAAQQQQEWWVAALEAGGLLPSLERLQLPWQLADAPSHAKAALIARAVAVVAQESPEETFAAMMRGMMAEVGAAAYEELGFNPYGQWAEYGMHGSDEYFDSGSDDGYGYGYGGGGRPWW